MFIALERLINLDDGYRQSFQVDGRSLMLLVVENQPLLLESRCPHQGASLHSATVVGRVLRCSRHGIEFDLLSGRPLNAACTNLTLLKPAYDGDRIGIDL
ncbi:Rieske iron-sulfur protein [Pseudomonas alcaligenes]|uniref:Rieske iron-sulfur protein n=1 Tax=Aquipseudomonas alcaligenes TaxID=43263 RepID=A0ABR7S111_AQUAC|nr:Rieske (2Fe-2S) protein [Pseudomonas alcaligenes]MBC9250634.1 Rieske iron-sulfur protein [Pseudomonas alcaligenes]